VPVLDLAPPRRSLQLAWILRGVVFSGVAVLGLPVAAVVVLAATDLSTRLLAAGALLLLLALGQAGRLLIRAATLPPGRVDLRPDGLVVHSRAVLAVPLRIDRDDVEGVVFPSPTGAVRLGALAHVPVLTPHSRLEDVTAVVLLEGNRRLDGVLWGWAPNLFLRVGGSPYEGPVRKGRAGAIAFGLADRDAARAAFEAWGVRTSLTPDEWRWLATR
jgi:hypothetical protein